MRAKLSSIIIVICIILLPLLTAASPEVHKAIEDYQKVQAENQRVRTFPFDEGNPSYLEYQLTDSDGYQWYTGIASGFSIYRFDGDKFIDMLDDFTKAEKDSLLFFIGGRTLYQSNGITYMAGSHFLYKWMGHKWKKYAICKDDCLKSWKCVNNKIVCIGENFYYILDQNKWNNYRLDFGLYYRQPPNFIYETGFGIWENELIHYWTLLPNNRLMSYTLNYEANHYLGAKRSIDDGNSFYLRTNANGIVDSTMILSALQKRDIIKSGGYVEPKDFYDSYGNLYLYFNNTNYLFRYDTKQKKFIAAYYPMGTDIGGLLYLEKPITCLQDGKPIQLSDFITYTQNGRLVVESLGNKGNQKPIRFESDLPNAIPGHVYQYNVAIGDKISQSNYPQYETDKQVQIAYSLDNKSEKLVFHDLVELRSVKQDKSYPFPMLLISFQGPIAYYKPPYIDKDKPGIHSFKALDLVTGEKYEFQLADPSSEVHINSIDPIAKTALITADDKHILIPMQRSIREIHAFDKTIYREIDSWKTPFAIFYNTDLSTTKLLRIDGYHKIEIGLYLPEGRNYKLIGQEKFSDYYTRDKTKLLFSRPAGNNEELWEWDLAKNKTQKITTLDKNQSIRQALDGKSLIILDRENLSYQLWGKSPALNEYKLQREGKFDKITSMLDSKLPSMKTPGENLLKQLLPRFTLLSDGRLICFPISDIKIYSNGESEWVSDRYYYSRTIADRPRTLGLIKDSKDTVQCPPFIFNPETGTLEFEPDWIGVRQVGDHEHVSYYEKDSQGQYYYRSSLLKNGKLEPHPHDFKMICKDGKNPINQSIENDGAELFLSTDNNLYYYSQSGWNYIDIKESILSLGRLCEIISFVSEPINPGDKIQSVKRAIVERASGPVVFQPDTILALRFERGIVKYPLNGKVVATVTSADGINFNSQTSMSYDSQYQRLLVATKDGIYELNAPSSAAKIHVPWIENNTTRIPASDYLKIKYQQRDLRIPVNILSSPDPRRFQIEYQLIGHDRQVRLREWSPAIEYSNLPAGKYFFSLVAYSPDGVPTNKLEIPIHVLAPFWDTWGARLIYAILVVLIIWGIVRLLISRLKRRNLMLEKAVEERTIELVEKQRRMTESIEYASLIQRSILPQQVQMQELFSQHFVLWRPRDVVGGDFYWLYRKPDTKRWLFAVIDCTGHGVPGALITMTVNSILNHHVYDMGIEDPVTLLQELHSGLGAALHQDKDNTQQDGLEISLIAIDKEKSELEFAGAGLHLIHWHPQLETPELIMGYKHGLGGLKRFKKLELTSSVISYTRHSKFYMYTDGIVDQPREKDLRYTRLGHPKWLEFIGKVVADDLGNQLGLIEEMLENMLTIHELRDDITIVGMKI